MIIKYTIKYCCLIHLLCGIQTLWNILSFLRYLHVFFFFSLFCIQFSITSMTVLSPAPTRPMVRRLKSATVRAAWQAFSALIMLRWDWRQSGLLSCVHKKCFQWLYKLVSISFSGLTVPAGTTKQCMCKYLCLAMKYFKINLYV